MTTYKTGQRFKAKIQGTPVEGKIYVESENRIYLCQNEIDGSDSPDKLGYKYSWRFISSHQLIADLELLPDADEFDKDNWVVDIEKEKDHPRINEFKSEYCKLTLEEWVFFVKFYGFMNGEKVNFSNKEDSRERKDLPLISIDTFFKHYNIPDADEPVKGSLVEVSDVENYWQNEIERIFTGGRTKNGGFIVESSLGISKWKHIRLAPNPEQLKREEAEKKALEWCIDNWTIKLSKQELMVLTEYILKEKM